MKLKEAIDAFDARLRNGDFGGQVRALKPSNRSHVEFDVPVEGCSARNSIRVEFRCDFGHFRLRSERNVSRIIVRFRSFDTGFDNRQSRACSWNRGEFDWVKIAATMLEAVASTKRFEVKAPPRKDEKKA